MSPTIHLVYPHGPGIATPHVIGRRLGEYLSQRHQVVQHDWHDIGAIEPSPGDILLGHPHPLPGTVFRRSFARQGWSRRVVLSPFTDDARQVAFLDPFVRAADGYLAITGSYWFRRVDSTRFAHWAPRMIHCDLAVDPADFPLVKSDFAPAGRRRVLYIGHTGWYKNVAYLSAIAQALPRWEFGWIGNGKPSEIPGFTHRGVRDTSTPATRELIASYDFLLTVGRADANPTTILEAMGWGLLPFCTPQSGYVDEPAIINVPLDDVPAVVDVLEHWQQASPAELAKAQRTNLDRLVGHFSWDRFGAQVEGALTIDLPPTRAIRATRRLGLAVTAATSPYGLLGGQGRRLVASALRRRIGGAAR